uniref:Putative ribonuclease H-like domain-containing protein n=1 Tax=Tanacetum cinerariifolium TaxID=118510 RepID=A0A699HDP7_TANCI|nr:putative ribonuclease H-like domain-containing protein [Tanacetum cinerariifolium]
MVAAAKLPVLNPNEFELWKISIVQYFLMTDYDLWEKLAKTNELKARGTLLMALPNEHKLKFNSYKTAKSLMEAIEKRFGGNKESKKVQKTLLKQQYENFNLLRSLPSEWKTHTLIRRSKPDLETLSMDDLYNNLKIYEAEVMSTNKAVSTAHGVSAASSKTNASNLSNIDSLRDGLEVTDGNVNHESQKIPLKYRKESRAPKHQDNRNKEAPRRTVPAEDTTSNAFVSQCDGLGYDWNGQTEDGPTNFALMAYASSSLESVKARLEVYKKNEAVFEDGIKILKLDVMFRDKAITELRQKFKKAKKERDDLKLTLEKFEGSSKNLSRPLDSQQCDKFKTGLGYDSKGFDSKVEFVTCLPGITNIEVKTSESKPKTVSAPIIEDWVSDSEDENEIKIETKQIKPSFAMENLLNLLSMAIHNKISRRKELLIVDAQGIRREFSVARTPQQNGMAERKNRTLIEVTRTMLADSKLPTIFWAEAVNIACYVQNRVLVIKPHNKTPYELFLGRKPALSFMRPFGCPVTILNTLDHLGKFDRKADDGFFVGYSTYSKAFRVFNTRTKIIKENLHITFLENKPNAAGIRPNWMFDIDSLTLSMNYQPVFAGNQTNGSKSLEDEVANNAGKKSTEVLRKENEVQDPAKQGDKNDQQKDVRDQEEASRNQFEQESERLFGQGEATNTNSTNRLNMVSSPVNVVSSSFTTVDLGIERAQRYEFESVFGQDKDANENKVFTPVSAAGSTYVYLGGSIPVNVATLPNVDLPIDPLMPNLEDTADTGIFDDVYDDREIFLMAKGPLEPNRSLETRKMRKELLLETRQDWWHKVTPKKKALILIRLMLRVPFLYGTIEEEVYVSQPPGFEDLHFPDKVYKVEKALYGLHQAPRAWYETLSTYLLENGFRRGNIEKNLFIKKDRGDILLVQVYVDDIIIRSTNNFLCDEFEQIMYKRFQMSSMGELTFFLGLQVKQKDDGIFISQDKFQVTPKTLHLHAMKRIFRYMKCQSKLGLWYPRDSPFNLEDFLDSDYVGASLDRKSTTGGCQFLGKRLISWQCKKQTIFANSTTKAEYVAAASCYGQVLWI